MKKLKTLFLLMCLVLPFVFFGCENKNQNSLSMPESLVVENGKIIFSAVNDAEYYIISVNDIEFTLDARFSNNVEIIDNKINFDADQVFVLGESYTIKVKAIASNKSDSSFTKPISYQHVAKMEKPKNVQINSTVLTWDLVEDASFYKVKVITPYDKAIFDEDGNILLGDDSESIAKANISEYSFSTNSFNFDSILSKAGNYNFYINAVYSNINTYSESGYTAKTTYKHTVQLETPKANSISNINGELHLLTVIDENANAVYVECGEFNHLIDLNNAFISKTNNYLDLNLNEIFKENTELDFSKIGQYGFRVQAVYQTGDAKNRFYLNSEITNEIYYSQNLKLSEPEVSLTYDAYNNAYLLNINPEEDEEEFVSAYKLMLLTDEGLKTEIINVNNKLIKEDFESLFVSLEGFNNYLASNIVSITKDEITNTLNDLSISSEELTISWNAVEDAQHLIEYNNKMLIKTENSITLTEEDIQNGVRDISITTIKNGYIPLKQTYSFDFDAKLATPSFEDGGGFSGKDLFVLTFTGSEHAIGYYVYIKSESATEFKKIEKIFTSTTIDLTQHVSDNNEITNYKVKVQAVADKYSVYQDSDLSAEVAVSRIRTLNTPTFYKVNGVVAPVTKQIVSGKTHYILNFYGVKDADGYEILINYNIKTQNPISADYDGLYQVDITDYLRSANVYEIKVRAISNKVNENIESSAYTEPFEYVLTNQLSMVTGIKVTENDNQYTVSFNPVENAYSYRVRIIKVNDSNYAQTALEVIGATNITDFVTGGGEYHIYITALASKNGFYADGDESNTFATLTKLQTLNEPTSIAFSNNGSDSFVISWVGDNNADYYLIKIVDPYDVAYEKKSYATSTNINEFITVQGEYSIKVYSMVDSVSDNAATFTSSSAAEAILSYEMGNRDDCLRTSITIFGKQEDYVVDSINELKNLLWYHYVYGVDSSVVKDISNGSYFVCDITLKPTEETDLVTGEPIYETVREALIRLATEANDNDVKLYNFNADATWLSLVAEPTTTESRLYQYLITKILELYPNLNILSSNVIVEHDGDSTLFKAKFSNLLNVEKVKVTNENLIYTNTDYGNDIIYLDSNSRRGESVVFAIDKLSKSMRVTTTEQLLIALQNGMKPEFVGDCEIAKYVYENAKKVLRLIVNDKMTDLEKATAIFDWISYAGKLNYYADKDIINVDEIVDANISVYGIRDQYYLEGLFADLEFNEDGEIVDLGARLSTSELYSKSFTLLCAIEGIETIIVNGTYNYYHSSNKLVSVSHTWNKVKLSTTSDANNQNWYAVDIKFSDNRIYLNDFKKGYEISSHNYFLVEDDFMDPFNGDYSNIDNEKDKILNNVFMTENTFIISQAYKDNHLCNSYYDYYKNSAFKMSLTEINSISLDLLDASTKGFTYSKEYSSSENYQNYPKTSGYVQLDSFLLNSLVYTCKKAQNNASKLACYEFRFNWSDANTDSLLRNTIQTIVAKANQEYSLKIILGTDPNSELYSVKNNLGNGNGTTTIVYFVTLNA